MAVDVRKLYEDSEWGWYDYTPMIEAFGNVAVREDVHDYQGDTWVLYDNNGKIGYLVFGWGSCSGCDALQGCVDFDELQDLCDRLEDGIMWFDNAAKALDWFEAHDWEGDWSWYYEECKDFVRKVFEYLNERV